MVEYVGAISVTNLINYKYEYEYILTYFQRWTRKSVLFDLSWRVILTNKCNNQIIC